MTIPNTSGAKQTKVFGTEEPGNTENTKEEECENAKGKLKLFQIQTKKQNRQTFWRIKNLLKQTENFGDITEEDDVKTQMKN